MYSVVKKWCYNYLQIISFAYQYFSHISWCGNVHNLSASSGRGSLRCRGFRLLISFD